MPRMSIKVVTMAIGECASGSLGMLVSVYIGRTYGETLRPQMKAMGRVD